MVTKIECDVCGAEVNSSEIKYETLSENKAKAICFRCAGIDKKKKSSDGVERVKNYVVYRCRRCDYRFKHDTFSSKTLRCPNCGKDDMLEKPELK